MKHKTNRLIYALVALLVIASTLLGCTNFCYPGC
jgi:hypothetical protein